MTAKYLRDLDIKILSIKARQKSDIAGSSENEQDFFYELINKHDFQSDYALTFRKIGCNIYVRNNTWAFI